MPATILRRPAPAPTNEQEEKDGSFIVLQKEISDSLPASYYYGTEISLNLQENHQIKNFIHYNDVNI